MCTARKISSHKHFLVSAGRQSILMHINALKANTIEVAIEQMGRAVFLNIDLHGE
jgi:hypothetical protein